MATVDVIRDMGDTLVYLLQSRIQPTIVSAANIFVATPDDFTTLNPPSQPTITVFLYRVGVNSEMRNSPRRTLPQGRTTRPLLPLELHYLITPWARETRDEYRVVGRILQALYDAAEIGPADLQGGSWSASDSVQLILQSLPVEEHFSIWETTDLSYRLSLTYMARVVGVEPDVELDVPPVVDAHLGRGP
jgi:hypothetical protein